ncbi:hypothetical protein HOD75_03140 [archaeon]|nr:hypothetical protein [archaeon]MBT4241868.1 hypothetical protein [archaeon]MBT4418415.1 hypothetical protein [archaeon]
MTSLEHNFGFSLCYIGDKAHAETCKGVGVMYSPNLPEIAERIAKEWVTGNYTNDEFKNRIDNYINGSGNLATVSRRGYQENPKMPVFNIRFTNANSLDDLEKTVNSFGLPFDKAEVKTDSNH